MGWRDRDWAKFTDDERAALFGGGRRGRSLPPEAAGAEYDARPPGASGRRGRRIVEGTVAVLVTVGVVAYAIAHADDGPHTQAVTLQPVIPLVTAPPRVQTTTVVVAPPRNVIPIRWRARDLAPAQQAGRICVTDPRHGRICASYVVGERPADTLTREIESRGLKVESTGSG